MAFKPQSDDQGALCEINVTPLVDVMLVLVIIFLVTAPLVTQSVQVTLPKTQETGSSVEKKPIQLEIDMQGKVSLDKAAIADLAALSTALKDKVAEQPDVPLYLYADQQVIYAKVAEVMAVVQQSGVSKFAFVTAKQ